MRSFSEKRWSIIVIFHDFECLKCGLIQEHFYKHSERDSLRCKDCESDKLEVRYLQFPSIKNLNTQEKVSASLKKRSLEESRKNEDRSVAAYEKAIKQVKK